MPDHSFKALVIGVDDYPFLDPDRVLRGAVADARAIADLLRQKRPDLDLTLLVDGQATRDAVLAGWDTLIASTQSGDEVLFYWSGHGSQVRDLGGDEVEADGWDETLVPHDSGRGAHPNRDVIDDEIFTRLQALSTITDRITIILDACHSGTAVRTGVRGVPRDGRSKGEPTTAGREKAIGRKFDQPRGASGWLPLSDRYVLLAACRDDQEALELPFRGQFRGAFTWRLCQELANTPGPATWGETFQPVARNLAASTTGAQIPQIEGTRGRALPWSP